MAFTEVWGEILELLNKDSEYHSFGTGQLVYVYIPIDSHLY